MLPSLLHHLQRKVPQAKQNMVSVAMEYIWLSESHLTPVTFDPQTFDLEHLIPQKGVRQLIL